MRTLLATITFISLISSTTINAQSDEYVIESFQDEYNELTEYESLALFQSGDPLFVMEYQLNFQFPLFGKYYDKLIYNADAWGYVTEEQDLSLLMMDFTRGYTWDMLVDTSNILSDIRFSHVETNNQQAFVIQYTKIGFFADPVEEGHDPSMNFQLWFFENGVMEVHFGKMLMNGTPIYDPGKGFYCYTSSGGVDSTEICGPHMGISDPLDETDAIALSGSYDDYEVIGNHQVGVLNRMPPEGWIIRFKPKTVGVFEPDYKYDQVSITPNPASSFINVTEPGNQVAIYALSGEIMYEGIPYESMLDISTFPSGIYCVKTVSERGVTFGKFIKP